MKSGEIKQIIKDSGLTISAISRKIGVSRETIYEWIKSPDKYSDLSTTKVYAKIISEKKTEAVNKLPSLH